MLEKFGSPLRSLDLQLALHRLSLYTLAVDDYIVARSVAQSLAILGEERSLVMHGVMSLAPPKPDETGCLEVNDNLLVLCHLAALIFCVLCVLPLPAAPFDVLMQRVRSILMQHDFTREWSEAPKLMLWISFMAAIVAPQRHRDAIPHLSHPTPASVSATGSGERCYLIMIIDRCLRRLKIDSFENLKESVLLEFLWLPVTNDADGMDLWDEIEASNPFARGNG